MGLSARNQTKGNLTRRCVTMWLAVFALVFQTFLPLSQAMAAQANQNDEHQFICTAHGIVQVPVDQDVTPMAPTNAGPCTHCMMHVSVALPPPLEIEALALKAPEQLTGLVLINQEAQSSIWRGLPRPSRAPPASV